MLAGMFRYAYKLWYDEKGNPGGKKATPEIPRAFTIPRVII
jgi:hypothetical protein